MAALRGGGCTPIAGATDAKYTAADADQGQQLRVDVTATATGGETDTASAATEAVKPGPPANTAPPTISGEARQRETLSGTTGSWTGSPTAFSYQWLRCPTAAGTGCVNVPGATHATYLLVGDDVGSTMRLLVQATNDKGPSRTVQSAPTGVVQPEVIRARLSISPSLPCTGTTIRFDGSASTTPNNPIVRYHFTYREFPGGILLHLVFGGDLDELVAHFPLHSLADGKSSSLDTTFTWNRQLTSDERPGLKGDYARDWMLVFLTVTDLAGHSSTASDLVGFRQSYSSESRKGCPRSFLDDDLVYAFAKPKRFGYTFGQATAKATIPCRARITCAGTFALLSRVAHTRRRLSVRKPAAKKPVLLAQTKLFNTPARRSRTVKAKVTRAGRRLLRPGKPIAATAKVTSVTLRGRRVSRSYAVTLRVRRR